ncbi:hypothetical protein ACHAPT_010593 [Fusarium lateritium]
MSLLGAPRRQLLERLPRTGATRSECPLQRLQRRPELQLRSTGRCLLSTTATRSYSSLPPKDNGERERAQSRLGSKESSLTTRVKRLRAAKERKDQVIWDAEKVESDKEYKKRYKTAARKWTSFIVAMPILLVTSYHLFTRLALGKEKKELPRKSLGGLPDA